MSLKENAYPPDEHGNVDYRHYTDSVEYYAEMHQRYLRSLRKRAETMEEANLQFDLRIHAVNGLVAKGIAALPVALRMLSSKEPDSREDGAEILAGLGDQPAVVDHLLNALERETDEEAKTSIIASLGHLRTKRAIPALARIIRDPEGDGETRWNAVESLGLIVRKRFVGKPEPIRLAIEWLESQGY
jgi:HEAT repeat protein